ncbi:hypothetical protein CNR22_23640 [Sphingobacteriaceae bacterium]|nr:hypothetical protein CNR22_23640 [Sphingobacteriaceae bacterium]
MNRFEKIKLCNGQCYLTKELKENEKKTEKFPDLKQKEIKFVEQEVRLVAFYFATATSQVYDGYLNFYLSNYKVSVFHPPQQA